MSVVIPIEAGTAKLYLSCGRCDPNTGHLYGEAGGMGETCVSITDCPHDRPTPEREWAGVEMLPKVRPRVIGGEPDEAYPIGPRDSVVLAEPCPTCKGYSGVLCGFSTCVDGRVPMVSARVAQIVPVFAEEEDPNPGGDGWVTHIAPARGYGNWCLWSGPVYFENPSTGRPTWKIEPLVGEFAPGGYGIRLTDPKEQP